MLSRRYVVDLDPDMAVVSSDAASGIITCVLRLDGHKDERSDGRHR
jgi:hypothetical protein